MIASKELETPVADRGTTQVTRKLTKPPRKIPGLLIFSFFLAVIVGLQIASGAYHCEFSGYPDEPAHYVTSLMIRDYIVHFHFQAPLRFAEDYYQHYPKVAIGHWPPFFYLVQSAWMMIFSVSRTSVRLELAVTCALLAYAVFGEARRWFGTAAGILAGLLTVMLPLVQDYSDEEMSEALLTLCCFWSVVYFARFVESEKSSDSWRFGIFFSLAVLTKGSGWLLALVPPIALLLTHRVRLVKKASFWYPVALVALTCVPWQLLTMHMAERGWDGGTKPSLAYTSTALVQFLGLFPKILGPVFVVFLATGLFGAVVRPLWQGRVRAAAATQAALLASVWIFHSIVPAGIEDRKLVIAVSAMVLFTFAGARILADYLPTRTSLFRYRYPLVATLGAAAFFLTTFTVPKLRHYGFIEAAHFLASRPDLAHATILVSSEAGGEGLLISEMAMNKPQPGNVILRGTKSLAEVGWGGDGYRSIYSSPEQIWSYLRSEGVKIVVLDTFAPLNHFAHHSMLRNAIMQHKSSDLIAKFPVTEASGEVQIFKLQ